jgi:pimeloyl-ACP methyl ester carboxylesterase
MKSKIFIAVLLLATLNAKAQTKDVSGIWEGKLNVGVELRLVFHFNKNNDGTYTGTMDSPDQNAKGIACSKVTVTADSVIAEIKMINGAYKAAIANDSTLSGKWVQGTGSFPLIIKHVEKASEIKPKPQTPQPPFNYNSEDVEYNNADSSIHFGATFTYPKTGGPFVTAILITGSGQQDRDETILGHKPFAVIADYLTKNGYAVLRIDDRGMGKTSAVNIKNATSADFAKDVEAGLAYINSRKEVDKNKIGLIGHSEGGLIADIIASRNKNIDFVIMLAGPGTKGDVLLADQTHEILMSGGVSKVAVDAYKTAYENILQNALQMDTAAAITASLNYFKEWKQKTDPKLLKELAIDNDTTANEMIRQMTVQFSMPWFKYFLQTNPTDYIKQFKCKVLALNGSKDIQVLPQQNLTAIKSALEKSKSKKFEVHELPGLNHLFQHCNVCTIQEYAQLDETFAPEALDIIAKWLNENVK